MSELPVYVTLLGEGSTNPALPSKNLEGSLKVKNGNVVFSSGNFSYKIPMEHIDKLYTYDEFNSWGDTWRTILLVLFALPPWFIAFPFIYYLVCWYDTAYEVRIVVIAWDEYYGLKSTTTLALGTKKSDRDRAKRIVQEIWEERGAMRRFENDKTRVLIREF